MSTNDKKFNLQKLARSLGWSDAGVCAPEVAPQTQEQYKTWLKNYKGPQMTYLEKRQKERLHPERYFPQVKSVLVFSDYYFPGWAQGEVKVSNYSWSEDYHIKLKRRLEQTVEHMKSALGDFSFRPTVDTSPVLEKHFAIQAGLGWQGKNSLVLNRRDGSLFFIACLLTDLDLQLFDRPEIQTDHCGNCRRCIDACPTDALEPYVLKADLCISYLTLEHKGPIEVEFDEWVAGCDICQEVCPWNQKLIPLNEGIDQGFSNLSLDDLESSSWKKRIKDKAVSYVKDKNWSRNIEHLKKGKAPQD